MVWYPEDLIHVDKWVTSIQNCKELKLWITVKTRINISCVSSWKSNSLILYFCIITNKALFSMQFFFSFPETVHCGPSKKIHPSQRIRRLRLHRTVGCRNLSERIGQDVDGLETNGLGLKKPQSRSVSKKNSVSKLCWPLDWLHCGQNVVKIEKILVETHFSELPDLRKVKTYTTPT